MEGEGKSIAIIGASADPKKYGNKAVKAYRRKGYTVYPVTTRAEEIDGLRAYRSIGEIPGPVDAASLYLPPEVGITVLQGIAEKGVEELYVNPGAESDELLEEAKRLGLRPVVACSILAIGLHPEEV